MSEKPEPNNSPETPESPENTSAQSPAPKTAAAATPTATPTSTGKTTQPSSLNQVIETVQPIAQKAWVNSRPTLTQILKATIGTLQSAVDRLEQQMATDETQAKPLNIAPVKQAANTFWTKTQPIWAKVIRFSRSRLPEDVNGRLTDRSLSGILAGLTLLLLWVTTHLPGGHAAPKPTAPNIQPVVAKPAPVRQVPPTTDTIAKQFPVDVAQDTQQPFPSDLSAPGTKPPAITPPAVAPSTTATAPSRQPTTTPLPTAAKPVKLTAEQKLMAKLQAVAGEQADLLVAVRPDKPAGILRITLDSDWYDLAFSQQDELAQTLLTKTKALRFTTLELLNDTGDIVARSPLVGEDMVVLLRQAP